MVFEDVLNRVKVADYRVDKAGVMYVRLLSRACSATGSRGAGSAHLAQAVSARTYDEGMRTVGDTMDEDGRT